MKVRSFMFGLLCTAFMAASTAVPSNAYAAHVTLACEPGVPSNWAFCEARTDDPDADSYQWTADAGVRLSGLCFNGNQFCQACRGPSGGGRIYVDVLNSNGQVIASASRGVPCRL